MLIFILLVITILLVIVVSLNSIVDYMVLFPSREPPQLSRYHGDYKDVFIPVDEHGKIHAWLFEWFPIEQYPEAKYIIYCHGNAGNIENREFIIDICRQANCNILLFDYRGFGLSSDEASLDYLIPDIEAVFQWLTKRVNSRSIIVWGESMGGSVATYLASKYQLAGLILLATFSSLPAVIGDHLGFVGGLVKYIVPKLRNYPVSSRLISNVECPITIMHSMGDEVIPYRHSLELQAAIKHHRQQRIVIRGTHSYPIITREQFQLLFGFYNLNYYHIEQIYQDYRRGLK